MSTNLDYVHSHLLTAAPSMRVGVLGRVLAILQAKEAMIASEDDKCLFLDVLFKQRHCTVYMFDDFLGTITRDFNRLRISEFTQNF